MPARSPSSQDALRLKWSAFDVVWAAFAPYYALTLREAYILSYDGMQAAALYCLISFTFALVAFAVFRLRDGMARYFSVHDAVEIAKAVFVAELMTCLTLFTFTRLDGIPRSTPIIHALVLCVGLVAARALARFTASGTFGEARYQFERKHVIMIGVSRLTALYMKFLEAIAPGEHQIIAVLDDEPETRGRSVNGVRIMGPASELESIIEEFAVHGVRAHRVVVGLHASELPDQVLEDIQRVCRGRNIDLGFVPELFGLTTSAEEQELSATGIQVEPPSGCEPALSLPFYFEVKRYLDFIAALVLLAALSPLWIVATCLALADVGSPVFFWQQRLGFGGGRFLLYKFRTLRTPFDERGRKLTDAQRLSRIGRFMRRSRLDELPQLLNVLVGDMSLIGPRPLLLRDQPKNMAVRLMVRPGITGWAQVNGGVLLSADEKELLDEWYIRNASPWLDLRILAMTMMMFLRGDRRTQHLEQSLWSRSIRYNDPVPRRITSHRTPALARAVPRSEEHSAAAVLRSSS
jgi:lipopolysaccharide/colanic/teichoic acid biosynthesis glycosyltransferase